MPPASRSRSGSLVARQAAGDVDQAEQAEHDGRPADGLATARAVAVGVAQRPPGHQRPAGSARRRPACRSRWRRRRGWRRPTGPGRPNQNSAPTTMAQPTRNSPTPSRRSAGSRSRAPGPIRRAAFPTPCASPVQTAASPRPSDPAGGLSASGSGFAPLDAGRAGRRRAGAVVDFGPPRTSWKRRCSSCFRSTAVSSRRRDEAPERLRDRGGEDARVAMLAGYANRGTRPGLHAGMGGTISDGAGSDRIRRRTPRPTRPPEPWLVIAPARTRPIAASPPGGLRPGRRSPPGRGLRRR